MFCHANAVHVGRGHPDRGQAVGDGGRGIVVALVLVGSGRRTVDARQVARHVPAVVRQEDIVDLHGEVIALVAKEYAACEPVDDPVPQQLVVGLARVAGNRVHHLLPAVGKRVDPQVRGTARPPYQRREVSAGGRSRLEAEGEGALDRHRAGEVWEGGPACGGGERPGVTTLLSKDGRVQAVQRWVCDVVAQPADFKRRLQFGQRVLRRLRHGHVAGCDDHRLILRPVGRIVRQVGVGEARRRAEGLPVVGHAFAVEGGLPCNRDGIDGI